MYLTFFKLALFLYRLSSWMEILLARIFKRPLQSFVAFATAYRPNHVSFDTDSFKIGVDSHASCTLSDRKSSFKDLHPPPKPTVCTGFNDKDGEGSSVEGIGTFCFNLEDDTGMVHTIEVPNSLYIPGANKSCRSTGLKWRRITLRLPRVLVGLAMTLL